MEVVAVPVAGRIQSASSHHIVVVVGFQSTYPRDAFIRPRADADR